MHSPRFQQDVGLDICWALMEPVNERATACFLPRYGFA